MKYTSSVQTPHIQDNVIVGWTLRVTATEGDKSVTIAEEVDLPLEDRYPVSDLTTEKLEKLINKIVQEKDMIYRASVELKKLV